MRVFVIFLLLTVAGSAGCSTAVTLIGGSQDSRFSCGGATIPRIYSGLFNDIRFLSDNSPDKGLVAFDVPFSVAADTAVLPYTVATQLIYGNLCSDGEKSPPSKPE